MFDLIRQLKHLTATIQFRKYPRAKASRFSHPIRSLLFAKKTESGLLKAAESKCDVIVLDMEDAVPISEKSHIRKTYENAISKGLFKSRPLLVRINAIEDHTEMIKDVESFSVDQVSGFVLPKISCKQDVFHVEEVMNSYHKRGQTTKRLVPIIECSMAYLNAAEIAKSSGKIAALWLGNYDMSLSCNTTITLGKADSLVDEAAVSQVVIVSRAYGIAPIAGAVTSSDLSTSEKFYHKMKNAGFSGATAVNVPQAIQANRIFSSDSKDLKWARELVEPNRSGLGIYSRSEQHERFMIGPPHIKMAFNMLEKEQSKVMKKSGSPICTENETLKGQILGTGLKHEFKIGSVIESNSEVTISESWLTAWHSSFLSFNPMYTSQNWAEKFGFESQMVPLMLLKTLSLSLLVSKFSEKARVHLGCYNAQQLKPVFVGDSLRALCTIIDAKIVTSASSTYTVLSSEHCVLNQRDEEVFTLEKRTMFKPLTFSDQILKKTSGLQNVRNENRKTHLQSFQDLIFNKVHNAKDIFVKTKPENFELRPGQLIFHDYARPLGPCEVRNLCTLMKITNPHHHNVQRYSEREILVPGPFVIAATTSNSDKDLGLIVHEIISESSNINKVNIGDQISTVSYISAIELFKKDDTVFEKLDLVQLGIKNLDLEDIEELPIPKEMFGKSPKKPKEYEKMCLEECDQLMGKIACKINRTIWRVIS